MSILDSGKGLFPGCPRVFWDTCDVQVKFLWEFVADTSIVPKGSPVSDSRPLPSILHAAANVVSQI